MRIKKWGETVDKFRKLAVHATDALRVEMGEMSILVSMRSIFGFKYGIYTGVLHDNFISFILHSVCFI